MQLAKILIIFLSSLLIISCQSIAVNTSYVSNYNGYDKNGLPIKTKGGAINAISTTDLWHKTRSNFKLTDDFQHARVIEEIKFFNRFPRHMKKVSEQANPFYFYVLQEVMKRDLPSEVALLPVIESLYNPNAYSSGKASGIWQFIPSTAKYLGIEMNEWYDGRRDLITSTQTALDYLERYNKRFDGDWLLTFAAYNSGGGTVSKAIRKNKEKGLPTDYWSLKLPAETSKYVPRILAISAIVNTPQAYNVSLPSIPDQPYFNIVDLGSQIDLNKVAKMARLKKDHLLLLNAGFSHSVTPPRGPHRVLVPVKSAAGLELALASINKSERMNWTRYIVKSGDNLGSIANKYSTSVSIIKQVNSLTSSKLRINKKLLIPIALALNSSRSKAKTRSSRHKIHKINNGDTVWDIAKKHKITVRQILAYNGLSKNSTLRVGAALKIPQG